VLKPIHNEVLKITNSNELTIIVDRTLQVVHICDDHLAAHIINENSKTRVLED
jgi:hypothetical protein